MLDKVLYRMTPTSLVFIIRMSLMYLARENIFFSALSTY